MSETVEVKSNMTQGEVNKILCTICNGKTSHEVLHSTDISKEYYDEEFYVSWKASYQIIKCLGCDDISFRRVSSSSDDLEPADDFYEEVIREELYPARLEGRKCLEHVYLLPSKVNLIYSETLLSLRNESPILAGIGLRALIETVCKEKMAQGKDLYSKIDDLSKKNILTPASAKILHKVRSLGNEAAHEVKPHTDAQLGLAMEVVEHLLKDVYILPKLVERDFD